MIRFPLVVPVVLIAAVTVTAQTPPQDRPAPSPPAPTTQTPTAQQPTPKPSMDKSTVANNVTYSGCLKPGATSGTWILENVEIAPVKPGESVATSGAPKPTLNLTTKSGTDLKSHANHKVEVTGTIAAAKPAGPSTSGAPSGHAAARQEFTVESFKMVSTSCP